MDKQIETKSVTTGDLLRINNLKKYYPIRAGVLKKVIGHVQAVDDISFSIKKGETLALVGESGCGKSTVGKSVLRLHEPTAGEVWFEDKNILKLGSKKLRTIRKEMQMIFQNMDSSLNPRMNIGDIVGAPLDIHKLVNNKKERAERIKELLHAVGLGSDCMKSYPHEFSGGQKQRIGIARALALNPKLVVADEPVSALDVSIQAQVINLMQDLQQEFNLTYLFISHDLSIVKHFSNRIIVMYLGKIMESVTKKELLSDPLHPYTKLLLASIPNMDPLNRKKRILLEGEVPSPINPPSGCRFHTRCPFAKDVCREIVPELKEAWDRHMVACHFWQDIKNENKGTWTN